MRESFLDRNRSVYSTNNESNLHVNLTQKARLYPFDAVRANIDKLQLYNEEKDASNNFRLIFTINPICSNVLFNMRTEAIKNEGSITDCVALVKDNDVAPSEQYAVNTSQLDREQAIKDTEYSHPEIGQWVYHCGLDIFNNHKLRTNSFIYISKVKYGENCEFYNTLWDYKRDKNGVTIEEVLIDDGTIGTARPSHVYQLDNILTFQEAVQQNLLLRNGWYGFVNEGSIEIPNGKLSGIYVNKIMNNNKACEVYNMYPDISLFSFVPKYNKYQQRKESNWDYCLTYPYFSDKNMFKTINNEKDGILIISSGTSYMSNETYHWYETKLPHNLSVGDYVRLYTAPNNFKRMRVDKIGDVNNGNQKNIFMVNFNGKSVPQATYIKKDAMGLECKYYFRVFKKLRNIDGTDFKSDLSRQAFGENIYGDRIAQLTFLDTINLDNLVDNIGRPLSEIYLTIVKRNKGWEKWYKNNKNYIGEDIEYSHCFGPVTCGLDLSATETDYNVHKLHNKLSNPTLPTPKPIVKYKEKEGEDETEITIDDEFFYGDIVEFNPYTFDETVISNVYYRFNTAQREMSGDG